MATVGELVAKAGGLIRAGRRREARALLLGGGAACLKDPGAAELLGWMAAEEGNWAEAARWYLVVADGRPRDLRGRLSLAMCLMKGGAYGEARVQAGRVWESGGPVEALKVLGLATGRMMESVAAAELIRDYLGRAPASADAVTGLAHALQYSGRADEAVGVLREWVERADAGESLLSTNAVTVNYSSGSAEEVLRAHRRYGEFMERAAAGLPRPMHRFKKGAAAEGGVLRVGLVSAEFRQHSVAYFLWPLMEAVDRGRVEFYCYHTGPTEDAFTARFEKVAAVFRRVAALAPVDLGKVIASDRVQVLVDLSGHTQYNRLSVFELRAAPVQVSYLGYPSSTGLRSMDYRVVDSTTDPVGTEAQAVEKPLRLDPCMVTFRAMEGAPEPVVRAEGPVVLACFGSAAKLNTALFRLYARVLEAVPGSVLLFKHWSLAEARLREELRGRMVEAGVKDLSRVMVEAPAGSTGDMLAQYGRVDISLDTYPYNGTTTICESLWMGVPVVSRVGDRTASRMGMTLLKRVGLEELAVGSDDAFVQAVAGLAADASRRAELRLSLRARVAATLGDAASLAREFEAAMVSVWEQWRTEG